LERWAAPAIGPGPGRCVVAAVKSLPGAGVLLGRHQGDSAEKEEKSEGVSRHRRCFGKTVWKKRMICQVSNNQKLKLELYFKLFNVTFCAKKGIFFSSGTAS
jgi:hypothetical protein